MENSLYKSLIHQTAILKQLDAFRVSGRFCDVSVGAGGKTFKCHRVLLAASSSYFESLFVLGQQMHSDYVTFVPLVSASSFEEILRFIYMAEFTISPENAGDLLEAATMLRIQPMVEAISHYDRSLKEGADKSEAPAPHTERSAGRRTKHGTEPRQEEVSLETAKRARLDDYTSPVVGETAVTYVQPRQSAQLQLDTYHSADRQQDSDNVYPEACYLTDTSPSSQYDPDATITVKREREDPGYDAAAWNQERPVGSAGNQRTGVPVRDIRDQDCDQWTPNPLYHDRTRGVLGKENQSGTESTVGKSFQSALEDNIATHGQIFEENLPSENTGNIKLETPPDMVTAGENGDPFDLQVQHGASKAVDKRKGLKESFHGNSSPETANPDASTGPSIGLSAAELLKTLSRRYECAKHQHEQEITDTELQRARPSPPPSENSLFSSWCMEAQPPQTNVQNVQPKKPPKKQRKKQPLVKKAGSDRSQFLAADCLEHPSPQSFGPAQRAAAAAAGPTLAALLESPTSSSPSDKASDAWTEVSMPVLHREPADQHRTPLRLARGSPEGLGQADRPCERNSQGGSALPHDSSGTTSPMEQTLRRAGSQSRKSVNKILSRLLTTDSYRDTCAEENINGEDWAGIGASQTLRSMCGEYLTTLPQRGMASRGTGTIEVCRGVISGQMKGRRAAMKFPQSTAEGGALGSSSGTSSGFNDDKIKHWTSYDKLSSDKEPHASLKDIQGTSCSTETKYPCIDLPVQGTDQLTATPSHRVSPALLTCSKDTSGSVGDDHWLTASETLRRISSRTCALASSAQVADTRPITGEDSGPVLESAGGLMNQEGPTPSQQVTGIKKEENREAPVPDMREVRPTLGRGQAAGDEDAVRLGRSLRAETSRPLLGPVTVTQGSSTTGNSTSQARYKDFAACDILKSMIHYHGQERQDQAPS
ncbi:uncharacterized protein LOC144875354 [Branchiostoma floridae x Branchiostoma japonicum]